MHCVGLGRGPGGEGQDGLAALLPEDTWHFQARVKRRAAPQPIHAGAQDDEDTVPFRIEADGHGRVGAMRLGDLTNPIPLFDLCVAPRFRGRTLGAPILNAPNRHVREM